MMQTRDTLDLARGTAVRATAFGANRSPAVRGLLLLLTLYRKIVSPVLPRACRFEPSCSAYAQEALERHGAMKGTWLAAKRLARCHPLGGHGYDPVPMSDSWTEERS
jgi:putative membrane protein insertion efficiency factor